MVQTQFEKINYINSINHKIIRNFPEAPNTMQNYQNQPNVLAPAIHDLNVFGFSFLRCLD